MLLWKFLYVSLSCSMYYFQLRVSTLKLLKKKKKKNGNSYLLARTSEQAPMHISSWVLEQKLPDSTAYLNPLVAKDIKKLLYPGQDTTGLLHQNSGKSAEKSPFIESNLKQCFCFSCFRGVIRLLNTLP